uniref:Leukocyte elastase inhibitor-like n=1 Tax=Crassostrea virginica TaxID=6565 RepID=A0A8B8AXS7_CRAVI|nr:leukocyte elastase inhibitor-like [Crassostrea virginica]XP_022295989.1 leukocyte elastase inhibitor-like [Crassostrea virginica]XP_022295990.1 leukocyte elastase inhibitor-like [Crassostrea virginica]XP_022295992.1 leukocyte elastase inhibitor-like [Crassostrea virginica]XP_022295993.1 leukocyte elastase inhibitor-like [Crassostrea virginica]
MVRSLRGYPSLVLVFSITVFSIHGEMASNQPFQNKETAAAFSEANRVFTLKLLKHLPPESNVFYSPFSISTALAMVHLGAKADTLKEMDHVLHFSKLGKDVHSAFGSYLEFLSKETGDLSLKTANRIYQSIRFPPDESFLKECAQHFKSTAEVMDFSKSEAASSAINTWVSQQTEDRIKDLVSASSLDSMTFMILINAIYFKGDWNSKFKAEHTQKMEFRNVKGNFMTNMMYQKAAFRFGYMPDLQLNALELPYKGKRLSMLILLPMAVDGISHLEKNLSESLLIDLVSNLTEKTVEVYLPKFKMETSFQLKPQLVALGMPSAFDENKADFSGIDKKKDVYISEVFHKAFVEVNEEGTEAAAATAKIKKRSIQITPEFRANHPFLFFIRDSVNDVTLFAGRFYQPMDTSLKDEL